VTQPRWLEISVLIAIHSDQTKEHGGSLGLRDEGLLDSALSRPKHLLHDQPASDLFALAASYGFGIARNHPFVDGNKRVAFQAMYTFLGLNAVEITASELEVIDVMLALASGRLGEDELASSLREHTEQT
jgi:death-on-curing protein